MIKTIGLVFAIAFLGLVYQAGEARAQQFGAPAFNQPNYNTFQPPVVSPYLGLLRNGNNAGGIGQRYFDLVRPQIQMGDALRQQQNQAQDLAANQQRIKQALMNPASPSGADPLTGASHSIRPTGHHSTLMSLGGRFLAR